MITGENIKDLIETTMKAMPLMPVEFYMCAPCETEFEQELMTAFVHRHFTPEQIAQAGKRILDAAGRFSKTLAGNVS